MPNQERIVTISVRYPESVLAALRARSKLEERALNTVIVRAARDYLANAQRAPGDLAAVEPVPKKKGGR